MKTTFGTSTRETSCNLARIFKKQQVIKTVGELKCRVLIPRAT